MIALANKALNYLAVLVLLGILLLLIHWGSTDAEPILEMCIVAALGVLGVHVSAGLGASAASPDAPPAPPATPIPPAQG